MKKLLVLALALVLALSLVCTASAEQKTYVSAGITDLEGNVIASLNDELTGYFDANGNDVTDQFPVIALNIDLEAGTCAMADNEYEVSGTCTVAEETETTKTVVATFEDESEATFVYAIEDDSYALSTGEYIVVLMLYA